MPKRAPKGCPRPGCPHVLPCPVHRANTWAEGAPGRRMPPHWQRTRRRILARDPVCRIAGPACSGSSSEVDHVVPGGGEHDTNLQGVCAACHRAKTQAEALAARMTPRAY